MEDLESKPGFMTPEVCLLFVLMMYRTDIIDNCNVWGCIMLHWKFMVLDLIHSDWWKPMRIKRPWRRKDVYPASDGSKANDNFDTIFVFSWMSPKVAPVGLPWVLLNEAKGRVASPVAWSFRWLLFIFGPRHPSPPLPPPRKPKTL